MKISAIFLFFALLLVPFFGIGQITFDNYVKSTKYKVETLDGIADTGGSPLADEDKNIAITYYDGLGRPMQTVAYKAGGDGGDIITPIVYDELGRQAKTYLPYVDVQQSGNSLSYRNNATLVPALETYYTNKHPGDIDPLNPNPYSEKIFEASPLNRMLEQGAPGASWLADPLTDTDHSIKFEYLSNDAGEVIRFGVSHPGGNTEDTQLVYDGYYLANQLYKTLTKDENWEPGQQYAKDHTTEVFTDLQGRTLLKRAYDENKRHDTYYVYDDYGNLTYVIPPLASDQVIVPGIVVIGGSINYPWTWLVEVDADFAQNYQRQLADYENEAILNVDLENEYGGQGGFSITTFQGSEVVTLGIVFSANQPFELRQGAIASLDAQGEFPDAELGVVNGAGYEYFFSIQDNTIWVEGEGVLSAINQNFSSNTVLSYSQNYPWTAYTAVEPDFAQSYQAQLEPYPNSQWLTVNLPNEHNGHGGLNISIDANDKVTVTIDHTTTTPFSLKQGLVIPLDTERRLADRVLDTITGPGYEYVFSIHENSLMIEGEGPLTSMTATFNGPIVVPPYISVPVVEGLCYIYHYDHRNRVVEKKIPGKGWEHIVYNKLDQVVLTQDANLRLSDDWLFTKYDAFGRVAYTGRYRFNPQGTAENSGRLELQGILDNETMLWESRAGTASQISTTTLYYTNQAYPQINGSSNDIQVHTVNYYDTYSQDILSALPASPGIVFDETPTIQTKGLSTGSKILVLGKGDWILSTTHYDEKGRVIYVASHNEYLKTLDVVETDLDFTGKVLSTKSTHTYGHGTSAPKPPITVVDNFTYDHTGRLLTQAQAINNGPGELIVNNDYDELGQLESKKVGGVTAANPVNSAGLQSIDYAYNIRGWLKGINDPSTALGADLFGFKINYDHPEIAYTQALYNGNISETLWKTANDNQLRSYAYGYDALNRILRADFHGGAINLGTSPPTAAAEDYTLAHLIYDKNGNILSLERKGAYFDLSGVAGVDIIDDLSYFYKPQSNTLLKVNDLAYHEGFKNGANGGDDYAYDLNGNLTMDLNKQIVEIDYNYLNLPTYIEHADQMEGTLTFVYSATGVKQKKIFEIGDYTPTSYMHRETDYAGNFIYERYWDYSTTQPFPSAKLKMFFHPEGYVEPVDPNDYSQGFSYAYQYKDIWRNVRLSYSDSNNDGNIDPATEIREVASYYPFGMRFGHNVLSGSGNDYKTYQGQEFTDELGLNVHEWKYRISDPAIGRFWQIDPLAEKYPYNSTYAFQENKLGIGVELEGLEVSKFFKKSIKWVARNSKGQYKRVSRKSAENILKNKGSVTSTQTRGGNNKAKKLMESTTDKKVVRDEGHKLANGKTGKNHYQKKSGDGSHVFVESAKNGAIVTTATTSEGSDKAREFAGEAAEIGATMTDTVENFGTNVFGDNAVGQFINDVNPLNLGFSDLLKDMDKTLNGETTTSTANDASSNTTGSNSAVSKCDANGC